MAKISLAGFADPVRRPRYIIWTAVATLVFGAFMVTALGVTSARWFCANACHKVQDDTITAYDHGSHSNISCMACHVPVNADPLVFMLHKLDALRELALAVTNTFDLPLNGDDEVSLTMTSGQCTQCHNLANRKITPSAGLKIDHQVHLNKGVVCTVCHNRVAHREDFTPTLTDPKTHRPNHKHPNYLTMQGCFRCHGQEPGSPAPGACPTCHTPGFDLQPATHRQPGFLGKGHAGLAKVAYAEVSATFKETGQSIATPERKSEWLKADPQSKETTGQRLVLIGSVPNCSMCHSTKFCSDCHGLQVPHSAEFMKPADPNDPLGHPVVSKQKPDACVMCHTKDNPNFCVNCHHGKLVNYVFNPAQSWVQVHRRVALPGTLGNCYRPPLGVGCHDRTDCTDCHFAVLRRAGL